MVSQKLSSLAYIAEVLYKVLNIGTGRFEQTVQTWSSLIMVYSVFAVPTLSIVVL